jgi:porin
VSRALLALVAAAGAMSPAAAQRAPADGTLWSAARGRPTTLTTFAQLGLGDERVVPIGRYAGGGVTLAAPFPSRALDAAGLAVAAAFTGSHAARAQRAAGVATTAAEATLELTYLAQITPWLAVQGDVQYVIHPGAVRARRNAVVPGLRLALMR